MNTTLLIDSLVQQTMVLIAQVATAGGVRAPLVGVADRVFADLTRELHAQGVTKKVIADMFGMALRTYHRRVQETSQSLSIEGRTVWEAVLSFIRENEPITASDIVTRFRYDDASVVAGVLNDLCQSGLTFRAGRGDHAIYRAAAENDLKQSDDETADWITWLVIYRRGPIELGKIAEATRLPKEVCERAVERLVARARVEGTSEAGYRSSYFETTLGSSQGWEAAVLDHYQALCSTISHKLSKSQRVAELGDTVGGSTWSFDVYPGHPLEERVLGTLRRYREEMETLRSEVDQHNRSLEILEPIERVVVYVGQNRL